MTRPKVLPEALISVKAAGIDTIISLLEPSEAAKLGLSTQAQACTTLALTYLNHPIRDMQLPDPTTFTAFATNIASRLRGGAHIAIHCHASIGRSGMLACAILGHFGYTSETALAHVSEMRGTPVPDTQEQIDFIKHIMFNKTTEP